MKVITMATLLRLREMLEDGDIDEDEYDDAVDAIGEDKSATANMAGHQGSETGDNCGIGASGFQPGNTCARGDGHAADNDPSKYIGATVGKAEQRYADAIEGEVARGIGGRVQSRIGNIYQPSDVGVGHKHSVEVKSLLKGEKNSITVHEDALLRKVDYMAGKGQGHAYHTVVIDDRHKYEEGAHADKHSGHRIYYRRGSGRYSLSTMHKVASMTELRRLIKMDDEQLPEKAKGSLPTDPAVIAKLRNAAALAHAARLRKDRALKARNKATTTVNAEEGRWVTTEGRHVWLGGDGKLYPGGPPKQEDSKKDTPKDKSKKQKEEPTEDKYDHGNPRFNVDKDPEAASIEAALPSTVKWKKMLRKAAVNAKEDPDEAFTEDGLAGLCVSASELLQKHFEKEGIKTRIADGGYEPADEDHAWLVAENGTIIDGTLSQFEDSVKPGQIRIITKSDPLYKHFEE